MADLLKNIYNEKFLNNLADILTQTLPGFSKEIFLTNVKSGNWELLELKQRMRRISQTIYDFLPGNFTDAKPFIISILKNAQNQPDVNSFPYIFLPDMVEVFGTTHYEESIAALEEITQFISAEFAVRPFLLQYNEKMMNQMLQWSLHPNHHVRRLASEGCRPRLPWAMALPFLKKDPSPIIPILENLKADESEYVRRSVANNLNDISKDHPLLVLELVNKWYGTHQFTNKLIKHACRTMLKNGNQQALSIFGFSSNNKVEITNLTLNKTHLKLGEVLDFSFICESLPDINVRLEYEITFARNTGKAGRKIFFIAEKQFNVKNHLICRKLRLQNYTTRKLYTGKHTISIKANGETKATSDFFLEV